MRKFLAIAALPFSLSLGQTTIAAPQLAPNACPSVAALQNANLQDLTAEMSTPGLWFSANFTEPYGTTHTWTFVVGNIKAYSADDAKEKALASLKSLQYVVGPEMGPLRRWTCRYSTTEGYVALTLTPPIRGGSISNAITSVH